LLDCWSQSLLPATCAPGASSHTALGARQAGSPHLLRPTVLRRGFAKSAARARFWANLGTLQAQRTSGTVSATTSRSRVMRPNSAQGRGEATWPPTVWADDRSEASAHYSSQCILLNATPSGSMYR